MAATYQHDERADIRLLLIHINEAWLQGRTEVLARYFHENMVIRGRDHKVLASGREACLASYMASGKKGMVHTFRQTEPPEVDLAGGVAITSYRWELEYEVRGRAYKESGREVMAFVRERERWQAIWRLMLPSQKRAKKK